MDQQTFSENLIIKTQKVFREENGIEISKNEAELYLEYFARLGMAALKLFSDDKFLSNNIKTNGKHKENPRQE